MPLTSPNKVNASLQLSAAASNDYSTLLIVDAHHRSFDRTKVYATQDGYKADVPEGTNLRKALDSAFYPDVKPNRVVVGRAKSTAIISAGAVSDGQTYQFTITVSAGASELVSASPGLNGTAETLFTAMKADIDANTAITAEVTATVVGTGNSATLQIALVTGDSDFILSDIDPVFTVTASISESAGDILTNIRNFNKDWTYMMATDHSPSFQISMAAQAVNLQKVYVTSTDLPEAYNTVYVEGATPSPNDVPSLFKSNSNDYAHATYHNRAEDYPEAARVTRFTNRLPGASAFNYKKIGFELAQLSDGTRRLNSNELFNLQNKSASTVISLGGQPVIAGNRVASGKRIEAIIFMLYVKQELARITDTLFLNADKLGMNAPDIGRIASAWTSFLDRNVSTPNSPKGLDPVKPYILIMPKAKDISFEDRAAGIITAKLTLFLDASIDSTVLDLSLTYRDPSRG